jgi:AraC family transcriptional regulator
MPTSCEQGCFSADRFSFGTGDYPVFFDSVRGPGSWHDTVTANWSRHTETEDGSLVISMANMRAQQASCLAAPLRRIGGEDDFREVAHRSRIGTIANSSVAGHSPMPSGYEPAYQLVLPYAGLFSYAVGQQSWIVDTSKILLIRPGWEYVDGQPVEGLGHASLLINPSRSIVDEIFGATLGSKPGRFGAARSSPELWLLTQYFLSESESGLSAIEADEWMIRTLNLAAGQPRTNLRPATPAVRRAKEFIHAHAFERLSLTEVAEAVGVSPVYLSNEFTRTEGVPLYQYQLYLRLARSLQALRDCDDITELALDLGFSSHSHFGATFRRTFGLSPSDYRRSLRTRRWRLPDRSATRIQKSVRATGSSRFSAWNG